MKNLKLLALAAVLVAGSALAAPGDGYWSTSGAKIVDASGNTIHITGSNWFGFETSNLMPHGLWSVNYKTFLDQVKAMGITVIRLPYSDDIMSNPVVPGINTSVNAELAGITTLQLMDKIIDYCGQLGIRIILDRHRPDSGGQSALWYTAKVSEATWIKNMQTLAARYKGNPTVVGFDLHNEPHADGTVPTGTGSCWGCGDTAHDWRLAAERGGNAVLQANPDLLIVVEGVSCPDSGTPNYWDNIPDPQCGWWGGYLGQAGQFPVRLSNPNKLVYSAHDYGMSVSPTQPWFLASNFPATLEPFWDQQWGYLVKQGIAPVLIGEFGSTLQDPKDQVWLPALLSYARTNGMSWTYWCLNPNSGDTNGLFLNDWTTIDHARYDVIKPFLTPLAGGGGSGPTTYALTVSRTGSGTVTASSGINCGTACSASYTSGTSVTLTATPAAGSTFAGWGGACTGTTPTCVLGMTAARSVSATFTSTTTPSYTLAVTKTGSGTVTSSVGGVSCGTACSASIASGTAVTLTAAPAAGYAFGGWSGACTGTGTCIVTMTADQAVGATFTVSTTPTYTLTVTRTGDGTVTSSAGGVSCGTACSASIASGTAVTLTATAASGSVFGGWSGACTGTGTCIVTMTANQSVAATFTTSSTTTVCPSPVNFSSQSGNFNTTGAICLRTSATVNGWGCSNFAGRTVSVNGGTATSTCGAGPFPLPKAADGYTYFSVTAGTYSWASIYTW